jgi:hypothetical protein
VQSSYRNLLAEDSGRSKPHYGKDNTSLFPVLRFGTGKSPARSRYAPALRAGPAFTVGRLNIATIKTTIIVQAEH